MENEKKVDKGKEIPIKQPLEVSRGSTLNGKDPLPCPKTYRCSTCGIILASDVFWRGMGNGGEEPFCGICGGRVEEVKYRCSICEIILYSDVFLKDMGNGTKEPFCKKCKIPVEEIIYAR